MRCVWSVSSGCSSSSRWMRSASVTSLFESAPRMRSATARTPDCFWCVAEFFRCSISPSAAADKLASSCCSWSGSSLMPFGRSVIEIGRPEERPGRINRDIDGVGELFAFGAPLRRLVFVGAPDVRVGVARKVALAVDQNGRNAAQQQLFDQRQRERRFARARTAEECRVALQDALVQRDRASAVADFAARKNARP